MTKNELLHQIESFVNAYMFIMKNEVIDYANENFTKLVNEKWEDSKSDDENILEVMNTLKTNIAIEKAMGNKEVVKVIETFLDYIEFYKIVKKYQKIE